MGLFFLPSSTERVAATRRKSQIIRRTNKKVLSLAASPLTRFLSLPQRFQCEKKSEILTQFFVPLLPPLLLLIYNFFFVSLGPFIWVREVHLWAGALSAAKGNKSGGLWPAGMRVFASALGINETVKNEPAQ